MDWLLVILILLALCVEIFAREYAWHHRNPGQNERIAADHLRQDRREGRYP